MHIHQINPAGTSITKSTKVDNGFFSAIPLRRMIQAKYGPDGALYILNYDGYYSTGNPAIVRVEYIGNCIVQTLPVEDNFERNKLPEMNQLGKSLSINSATKFKIAIYKLNGERVFFESGRGQAEFYLPKIKSAQGLHKGLYLVVLSNVNGKITQKIIF